MKHGNGLWARRILALLFAAVGTLALLPVRARAGTSDPALLDTPWNEKEGRIPTPTNLRECLDECEYQKGRRDEACARKRDPIKRKQCFAESNDKYAKCQRECYKKYPEK